MIPFAIQPAQKIPVPAGEKAPRLHGWQNIRLSDEEAQQHLSCGGNLAIRLGAASGGLVDADLDCAEALTLAELYLPGTGAIFGRASKEMSHWLYLAAGAVFATYADPLTGDTLCELRADGRDGGAHLTLIPPSVTSGERREWHGETVEPAAIDAAVLARRMAWLAIGCLTMRHLSEHAARRPYHDLPDILWEADPALGRRAYHWIGRLAPDEHPPDLKPRRDYSTSELRLEEIVAAIPNNYDWEGWNRIGMAIYAASSGSEIGFVAFDDFSSRSSKYDPHAVLERWRNYRHSPPTRISLGTLVHLAHEAGWRRSAAS
jgi:hypothetical protein